MASRRSFFKKSFGLAGGLSIALRDVDVAKGLKRALNELHAFSPEAAALKEDLWEKIAASFTVSKEYLDLNNAGISPQPNVVQQAMLELARASNEGPSFFNWNVAGKSRITTKKALAELAGADESEIAINRNATEALATVTWGLPLNKGDEIVMSNLDYPNMIHAWKQREMRDGIKIRWLDLQLPIDNEDTFVNLFTEATNDKTRVWHITHMINWNGQILPVMRLCAEARKRGVLSIVDGAQSFAHLDFRLHDIDPDYFGASLHKWLCAPPGLGMLYVKKENIASLWPLFPDDDPTRDDIKKFEALGTRSILSELALAGAITFHQEINSAIKEQRLRYLKNYWCEKVKSHQRIKLHTSLSSAFSCAIANFSIDGISDDEIRSRLFKQYKIITISTNFELVPGVRVSPSVYTLTKDLDRLVAAILQLCNR